MAFSDTSYTGVAAGILNLQDLLNGYKMQLDGIAQQPGSVVSALTAFGVEWGPIVGIADDMLAADSSDASKQYAAAHAHNLVDDYNALLARAQAMATAIQGL